MRSSAPLLLASLLLASPLLVLGPARTAISADTAGEAAKAPDGAPRTSATNLVILLADDLGWNDVGYHGSDIATPAIDALAAKGTQLDRLYAYPACRPTRASLMTGLTLERTRVAGSQPLPVEVPTLAGLLRDAGYQTWMAGKWDLGGRRYERFRPHRRGFDAFYGHLGGGIDYFTHRVPKTGDLDWWRDDRAVEEVGYSTHLLADQAIRWIDGRDPARPFFLYLSFNAVHAPLQAPEEALARHANPMRPVRSRFAAVVGEMDAAIGRVVAAIDRAGLAERTIVLFASDNGGVRRLGSSNAPLAGSKLYVDEGGIRVPAILRQPGTIPAGAISRQLISVVDLLPTLLTAVSQPGPTPDTHEFDGVDLWRPIRSGTESDRPAIAVRFLGEALVDGRWKLLLPLDGGAPRLYDLQQDPSETRNLADREAQRVQDLLRELRRRHPSPIETPR